MNSMTVLNELRAAQKEKLLKKKKCDKIKEQLEHIYQLQNEKVLLSSRLQALVDEISVDDLLDADLEPSVQAQRRKLRDLKEKLVAHRIIGPCGLTVVDVAEDCLVVTFTATWKDLVESFVLKIMCIEGQFVIKGSTIPYFIDVEAMMGKSKMPDWSSLMDSISNMLNAYMQRKSELESVKCQHEAIIGQCSTNQAVTSIEISLASRASEEEASKVLTLGMEFPNLDAVLPSSVHISKGNIFLSKGKMTEIRKSLQTQPMSSAFSVIAGELKASETLHQSRHDGGTEESMSGDEVMTDRSKD